MVFKALNGLYVFIPGDYVINPGKKPSDIPSSSSNVFVQTIADNESLFTAREVRDAKEAHRVFINLGRDGIKNFRFMVLHHLIKNITFNASDVDRAEIIYGKDLGVLRGKTVRRQPKRVTVPPSMPSLLSDSIMRHLKNVIVCADIMFVDKIKFFVTISSRLQFGTADFIPDRKYTTIYPCFKRVFFC